MRAEVEDWPESRIGIRLELGADEIEPLRQMLQVLRKRSDQHFHLSADDPDLGRVGDIEISVMYGDQIHNLSMTSIAYFPGDNMPLERRRWSLAPARSLIAGALGVVGVVSGLNAALAAYGAHPSADYRSVLSTGVWESAMALVALHASGVAARAQIPRLIALAAALAVVVVLFGILQRLSALAQ